MVNRNSKSRSEDLRAKRKTSQKRSPARKPRTSQSDSQNKMPPVLMRSGFTSMAQPKRKKKNKVPKRRYDIALSSPGVEIRLPAMPSIHLGWRLVSAALATGLLFLLYHFWTAPIYQVQAAELEGTHYLNIDTVNSLLNLYNKPIFMVDPQQMETDLQRAFPGLMVDASVQIVLPATVIVTVEEREPVILWEYGGKMTWVDGDGISFDPIGENNSLVKVSATGLPPAPVVILDEQAQLDGKINPLDEILTPEAFMAPEMVAAILTMDNQAPDGVPLAYDPQHGLGWHDKNRGWDVYFGMDVFNIAEKLVVYKAIRKQLKNDGISPVMISVEHIHAPYYRLEQ